MIKTYASVIGVVKYKNKVLLLKRTSQRRSSPNKWQPASGFIGEKEPAEEAVLREVKEETGLEGEITRKGKVFEVTDNWGRWVVIPFLVEVSSNKVEIDSEEHTEYKWVKPQEIGKFDLVAGVRRDLMAVGLL